MAKDSICGMQVDEKKALSLKLKEQVYYFCSKHCLEKFIQENRILAQEAAVCNVLEKSSWYKNKVFLSAATLILLSLLAYLSPTLVPFKDALGMYLKKIWWAVSLGLLLGGIIDHFVPREYISRILSRPTKNTIFSAVGLGFLMSACSHGILALTIQLHKKGASNPAVVSFLLASPWANLPLTVLLLSFFGLKALYIIFGAIIIAVNTGIIFQILEKKGLIEKNQNTLKLEETFSINSDLRQRLKNYRLTLPQLVVDIKGVFRGTLALANMVLWWILLGIGLASLLAAYLPAGIFQRYMGPTLSGLLVTLFAATIIEVCSEGTAPLAFEIYRQTTALGNSFVFLMAGVVTDYTEIGLIWTNVGKKTALWLPLITVPQVVILGLFANRFF